MTNQTFDVPLGRLQRVAPGLPTADVARTVDHYGRIGFHFTTPDAANADFAIAAAEFRTSGLPRTSC